MRIALCNEVLQPLPFAQQCKLAADLGYDALEVAPFTLAQDPMTLTDADAQALRRTAGEHGLKISGLHWLLVAPAGLSIVDADAAVRSRTVDVMRRLVELCALMGGTYLVHGSPKQRRVPAGSTRGQAWERARDCFRAAGQASAQVGVTYCIEPLAPNETDLLNTVEEAARMADEIGLPSLRTMIDCSAAGQAESEPVHALLRRWLPTGRIAHVQVNDPNRRGPGQGTLDFAPILRVLCDMERAGHFAGLVAVEPFDHVPDGAGCAARAVGYLRGVLQGLEDHD